MHKILDEEFFDGVNAEDVGFDAEREFIEKEERDMRNKIRKVFGDADGKEVANWIFEKCLVGYAIFTSDSLELARRSGKQELGLELKKILEEKEEEKI